jgi:diguanylate cyclase (GGDEF)-like protein
MLATIVSWQAFVWSSAHWEWFAVLLVLATLTQLVKVPGPTHETYHINLTVLFAGLLIFQPFLYVVLVVVPHVVEWVKERLSKSRALRHWYIQPFNMSVHIGAGLSARWLHDMSVGPNLDFTTLASVAACLLGAVVYVVLNHLLVGQAIALARRVGWRESGILNVTNLAINLVLLVHGYVLAVVWSVNPALSLPALAPLALMYSALRVPKLTKEAQTDEKTGLANARHFMALFTAEMEKASRLDHPLALLMTDLDLLRNINNTYGHLAGDAVLGGVARIIRQNIRSGDIAGRFGGEEFCIALPETTCADAVVVAERLRARVAGEEYYCPTLAGPIRSTVSIGIACYPSDAALPFDLIHKADMAVYQAKLRGRNCVVVIDDLPADLSGFPPSRTDRMNNTQPTPFAPRPERPRTPPAGGLSAAHPAGG